MAWHKFRNTLKMRVRLLLLCYIHALKGQVIQYPGWVNVDDGGTVRLLCRTDIIATHLNAVVWKKIDPMTKKLTTMNTNNTGVSDRQGTEYFMDIKNANVVDSGTYYCSVTRGTMPIFGNGSIVTVTQENRTEPPPVDILWPRGAQSRIPLLCVVSGVVPSQVRVFWVIDGEEDSGMTESFWTKDDGKVVESTQNQVLVPAEEWEGGAVCTCVVAFAGKNISKSVHNQGSHDACVVLLYGALAGACLSITAAICISVFLHRVRSARSDGDSREQRRTTDLEHIHRSGNEQRGSVIDQTVSEVQYASLEEASLARRTYRPTILH